MADVRSLLRSEQASRRISHPYLSYTRSGQLNCTVCDLLIKSASLWEGHLRSPNHRKNAQVAAERTGDTSTSKKRKNDDSDDESRKRSRPATGEFETATVEEIDGVGSLDRPKKKPKSVTFAENTIKQPIVSVIEGDGPKEEEPSTTASPRSQPTIDEDEWAAFEREVAPLAQDQPDSVQYSATIVAAPMSAADIAAGNESSRRLSKEVEAEEEKEDDERRLEEELDVMEEMEERVRRLREKREALRKGTSTDTSMNPSTAIEAAPEADKDVSDESEDEDYDDWGFQ